MRRLGSVALLMMVVVVPGVVPDAAAKEKGKAPEIQKLSPLESASLLASYSSEVRSKQRQMSPDVVLEDHWNWEFVIPLAGNTPGSRGTYFRSDVTFANQHFDRAQRVALYFLPAGTDNNNAQGFAIELDPGEVFTLRDLVGELNITGLGTLLVFGIKSSNELDQLAAIDGYSRVWTPESGNPSATASAQFNAARPDLLEGWSTAIAIGLRNDPGFRTNIGVVNLSSIPRTWNAALVGESGGFNELSITVPPLSVIHLSAGSADVGNGFAVFELQGDPTGVKWLAYGTTNDNVSGDGWVSFATRQREDAP